MKSRGLFSIYCIHPFNHHTFKAQFQRIFITGTNNLLLILESAVFLLLNQYLDISFDLETLPTPCFVYDSKYM